MNAEVPFSHKQLDQMEHLTGATLAPGRCRVAAALNWREAGRERSVIRIVDFDTATIAAQVDGGGCDEAAVFSPDGSRLAFLSDRTGRVQLHTANADGQDVEQLTDEPRGVQGPPRWSPDGTLIAVTSPVGPAEDPAAPQRITRAAWRLDGVGMVDRHVNQVLVVGATRTAPRAVRLTGGDGLARPLAWAPDSQRLLIAISMQPIAEPGELGEVLWEVALDGVERALPVPRSDGLLAAYVDGERLAVLQPPEDARAFSSEDRLWVIHADGTRIDRTPGVDVGGDVQTDAPGAFLGRQETLLLDGDDAIVRTQRGGSLSIHRVALAGATRPPTPIAVDLKRCHYPLELRAGSLLYATSAVDEPASLVVMDLAAGRHTSVPVGVDALSRRFRRPIVERDVGPRDMWFFHPTTRVKPPYPTVLLVHGGPHLAFGETFFPSVQLLCGAGFAVLMGNPSGSRGYGDTFAQATYQDWGGLDADELLAAVDDTVDRGHADPERLAVCGLSYGGYMACLLAARTSRFAAAVAENPVTDLLSQHWTSDVGPRLMPAYFGDDPAATALYRERSPLTYAAQCRTPTLLIIGLDDARVPPDQGTAFYAALREAGCAAEMLLLPAAGHLGSLHGPLAGKRAQEQALVGWFAEHLT